MEFTYEAMSPQGQLIRAKLDAPSRSDAADALRDRGWMVVRLDARGAPTTPAPRVDGAATSPGPVAQVLAWMGRVRSRAGSRDLLVFTRQLKMLLESGAPLVAALSAIEAQTTRRSFRGVVRALREQIEGGRALHEALAEFPGTFDAIFRSMAAAGEATATLPEAFHRLHELARRQQQVRRTLVGATIYPALLCLMLAGVLAVMIGFVVPRFGVLFDNLNRDLPLVTRMLVDASAAVRAHAGAILGGAACVAAGTALLLRSRAIRGRIELLSLRLPLVGPVVRRLNLARILRVWAALLRSHVPLLETIAHSRRAVTNAAFVALVERIEEVVSTGGRAGRALAESPLIEPVLASAISTGEENARLTDAVEFVSAWLDDENAQMISGVTRVIEPLLLALMGLIIGVVAMALFVPLFDIATAAGG